MKTNLFKDFAKMSKKTIVTEKATTNKATATALREFFASIEAEFNKVVKSDDIHARNLANAVKGKYQTALNAISACYPYQTATPVVTETTATDENGKTRKIVSVTGGVLLYKATQRDENGNPIKDENGKNIRIWAKKNLTRASAMGIVKDALKNYTNTIGNPVVVVGVIGEEITE